MDGMMNKKQAGQLGGQATYKAHGKEHMQKIGKAGATTTWDRYHLSPIGQSGWALVDRKTNQVKTFINFIPDRR
jgi:general stress protein YciG